MVSLFDWYDALPMLPALGVALMVWAVIAVVPAGAIWAALRIASMVSDDTDQ